MTTHRLPSSPSCLFPQHLPQDTLRDCDHESTCYNTVISPIYFVSFVLTAQFVLVNVVIAVLMKHLEESNKEAKEEAELEAELEARLARVSLERPRVELHYTLARCALERRDREAARGHLEYVLSRGNKLYVRTQAQELLETLRGLGVAL